jgi:hypothetical protein
LKLKPSGGRYYKTTPLRFFLTQARIDDLTMLSGDLFPACQGIPRLFLDDLQRTLTPFNAFDSRRIGSIGQWPLPGHMHFHISMALIGGEALQSQEARTPNFICFLKCLEFGLSRFCN